MKYLFTSMGGSGSMHTRKRLKKLGYIVHWAPTKPWYYLHNDKSKELRIDQQLMRSIYAQKPAAAEKLKFDKKMRRLKTKFVFDDNQTIGYNITRFLEEVRADPRRTVVMNPLNFPFSDYGIQGLVFCIRHPMHQFLSLVKPKRHPYYAKRHGGVNTDAAVRFAGDMFNAIVDEYFACQAAGLNPKLIRYEYADQDCKGDVILEQVYEGWLTGKRNTGLDAEHESLLLAHVRPNYFKLYQEWEI